MATLPESSGSLTSTIAAQNWPTNTYYVDKNTKRITGMTDGLAAMEQAVEIIVNVERYFWQIYGPSFGMEWNGLIGRGQDYAAVTAQRRLRNAFSADSRITGMSGYTYSVLEDKLSIRFTVHTVYGDVNEEMEVAI